MSRRRQGITLFAGLLLWVLSAVAHATDVSGEITLNTSWTFAAAPYNVTGAVRVSNGATLTIEAGVLVYMAPGTSLTVEGGQLVALGTNTSRIVITSVRDQAGASPAAAPGDWQQIKLFFNNGGPASALEYVTVRYGQGLLINHASPTLESVALENNAGPAITVDLLSSPQGTGLTANGNALNGIAVPAGELTQGAHWALLGIPYVVSGGILHVGERPAPLSLAPANRYLEPGDSSDFLVSLAEPVTASTQIDFISSAPEIATIDPTVIVPAGAFSASIAVHAVAGGSAVVTATRADGGSATAVVTVAPRPTLQLAESPFRLSVGRTRELNLFRSPASAFANPAIVTLADDPDGIAQVPATVNFAAGAGGVNFPVVGLAAGSSTLTVSAIGYIGDSALVVVEPLSMSWPALVKVPIGTVTVRLLFSDVVPPGGMTVAFESSDPTRLTVPATLPVPAGATELNVPLTGVSVGPVTLTVNNTSYGQASVAAEVEKLTTFFDVSSRTLPAGFTEPFTVVLSNPAPQGGVTVLLGSTAPEIATPLPNSVTIAAGASSATIDVHAIAEGAATITTSGSNLEPGALAITVGPPAALRFSPLSNSVGRGLRSRTTAIQLRSGELEFRPRRNVQITLANADSASLTLPANVMLLAGASEVELPTVGILATAAPVNVDASASEVQSTSVPLGVNVVESTLAFVGLDNIRSPQSLRDEFWLQWWVPGVTEQQTAATNQTIELAVVDALPDGLVDGFYFSSNGGSLVSTAAISAGGTRSANYYVAPPNAVGTYKVRANIAGFDQWTSSEQTSADFNLQFSVPSFVSGKLLDSGFVKIRRQLGGAAYTPNTPLNVNLVSSDPSRVSTNSVVIPANAAEITVPIIGREVTSNTQINAAAAGFASPPPLNVSVVEPTFEFVGLDDTRVVGAARDQFSLIFKVLGSEDVFQSARLVTANVEVINAAPVGIVEGIFGTDFGGLPVNTIGYQGFIGSVEGYVGSASAVGSYALRATVPGLSLLQESLIQTVTGNMLQFDDASVTVGKGLRTTTRLRLPAPPASGSLLINLNCAVGNCSTPPTQILNGAAVSMRLAGANIESPSGSRPINMNCAAGNCSALPPDIAFPPYVDVPVVGESIGSDTLTADSAPAPHGSATLPVQVVQSTVGIILAQSDSKCQGGWYVTVAPGVANQDLDATITIVDQTPPGILTGTYNLAITEGQSTSDNCYGLELGTPSSLGSYRLRVTIPGLGSFDSDPITVTNDLSVEPPSFVAARGLNSRIVLSSLIAAPMPVNISASCVPTANCVPEAPVVIPASSTSVAMNLLGTLVGAAVLNLSAPGFEGVSANVDVREPVLFFSMGSNTVQVGQELTIYLGLFPRDSFDTVSAPNAITFTLTGSSGAASVPATVEMPAGETWAELTLHGLEPGTYSFTVDWPGVGIFTSATITVTP